MPLGVNGNREYNDYILNVRVVSGLEEALTHIRAHSTKHSECIITEDDRNALLFLNEVDASAVYQNHWQRPNPALKTYGIMKGMFPYVYERQGNAN